MAKKYISVTIFALFVLAVGFTAFRIFEPSVGFTYYEPSYLPANVSVKAKRISINKYAATQVEQNFRTEDWIYSIREYRANQQIGTADHNYDAKSVKPTCAIQTSPKMTKYRICHWIDYGKIDVHEVQFIKGGTFINAQIPTKVNDVISINDISKFVDSFAKKSTIGLPVIRSSGA